MVAEVVAEGRSVFLSSHVLDEVGHLCDRVGIIREGRLVAVEDVEDLRARAVRDVRIRFGERVDPAPFRSIPGVSQVHAEGRTVSLRASGDLDALVKLAASHHVLDFVSSPAELEEVFLSYYRQPEASS
jgi:ABC-2 type transport system ATP-binding protein